MEEVNKDTELDNTDKKLHISDVIDSKTPSWNEIFDDDRIVNGLYRLPSGNYIRLVEYFKQKFNPPTIK